MFTRYTIFINVLLCVVCEFVLCASAYKDNLLFKLKSFYTLSKKNCYYFPYRVLKKKHIFLLLRFYAFGQ